MEETVVVHHIHLDEISPHVVTAFLYSRVQRTFNTLASVTERYQCTDGPGHWLKYDSDHVTQLR